MFCIPKTRADMGNLVPILESAFQIYPEMGLIFDAPKCVLASVIVPLQGWKNTYFWEQPYKIKIVFGKKLKTARIREFLLSFGAELLVFLVVIQKF
jgi:hypothetical protein